MAVSTAFKRMVVTVVFSGYTSKKGMKTEVVVRRSIDDVTPI